MTRCASDPNRLSRSGLGFGLNFRRCGTSRPSLPPSSVSRPPSTVHRLPSTVHRLPSTVHRLPSTVHRLPSTVLRILSFTLLAALLNTGCASARLNAARRDFYQGNLEQAAAGLEKLPPTDNDRVLFLMERGTVHQAQHAYRSSCFDYLQAAETAEELDYYSVSKGAASFVTNDRMLAYRGAPYERTLLHAFTAKNYLAQGMWDDAGVEARNIVERLENLNGFPDDPYSRYLAAVCFELMNDSEAAAFQYRALAKQLSNPKVDPQTGRFEGVVYGKNDSELICFVLIGRSPTEGGAASDNLRWGNAPYAELYSGDRYLGRSFSLADTERMVALTGKRLETLKVVKTVSRIVIKDTLANVVAEENELLGAVLWLLLFATERPDTRRWVTLPAWLQVARIPCPGDLQEYNVLFKNGSGATLSRKTVRVPLRRRGNVFVSFVRDWP